MHMGEWIKQWKYARYQGLNSTQAIPSHPAEPPMVPHVRWCRPPRNWLKCNVSASWGSHNRKGGAAWIVQDHCGIPLFHSRRAFFNHTSIIEAELQSLLWSIRALIDLRIKSVVIESSLIQVREALLKPHEHLEWRHLIDTITGLLNEFDGVSLEHVVAGRNKIASSIAQSVTSDHRYQSYVATGDHTWLSSLLRKEELSSLVCS
ncbi:hypothetical protein F2Q69_00027460 [Brassica cretica]|uniref:RNase H type-1 domain-containing protein n=1 Tax=Brassica cretica TaxID=69181 RepID=A0A8S9S7H1_BRACR|nr:hypothetical protein F2Q69_00027460 [Brassica cretica]